jgi:hypothetical protein
VWAGVDNAWEQEKPDARKMIEQHTIFPLTLFHSPIFQGISPFSEVKSSFTNR